MSEQGLRRPRQVTISTGIGLAGCFILLIGLFDSMAHTRTVDARDSVADFLSKPPGEGLGLSVAEALDLWRVTLYVAGGLAAAAFVFGIYVFQRHNGARIGFTVVTALLLLAMPLVGIMPILLAIAAVRLWTEPARDWFAGRTPRQKPARETAVEPPSEWTPPPPPPQAPVSGALPPASYPYGAPPEPVSWAPPQLLSYQPPMPPRAPDRRPGSVVWATVLTWVFSGLTGLVMALIALFAVVDQATFKEELQKQLDSDAQLRSLDVSVDQLLGFVIVICAAVALWALAAAVVAIFAWRRQPWARIMLVISASGAALFSLVAILGILPILTLVPSIATVFLLFSKSSNAWYAGRPATPQQPKPQTPPKQNGPW
ncbi:MAG TPA: hypothetical protein VLI04_03765 [Nocardioidaceae bacterium]|nr:hypothetical protein [Nocardioidaceae bacterium]